MRVGIVVPHIFMHRDILPRVIFSPARLAVDLAEGLHQQGVDVTLFTPGPIDPRVRNVTADLSLFESELEGRGYGYMDLLKKHPMTFVTMARQVQAELIHTAYEMANNDELDIVHVYTNEEELGMVFANLCKKPVVFTHHDPFNFLIKYTSIMPKYADLPWISMSMAQRMGMPKNTNWVANIYHGLTPDVFTPVVKPSGGYVAYLGRIIEPKGVHVAIEAVRQYNARHITSLQLRIAGKHYSGHAKDEYWQNTILPQIDGTEIIYDGFIDTLESKREFLANAEALLVPSLFDEPFGMVSIEAFACGTPVIALDSGALPEVLSNSKTGSVVEKQYTTENTLDIEKTATLIADELSDINSYDRSVCRAEFESRFTVQRMCAQHLAVYKKLTI